MIRLTNNKLGRALHEPLYERIHNFAVQHTPEVPAHNFVNSILMRLYADDPHLYLFVELDDNYRIIMHAIVDVQEAFGSKVMHCYQIHRDKADTAAFDAFIKDMDTLALSLGIHCMVFSTERSPGVYEKKYGYRRARSIMLKVPGQTAEDNDSG